MKNIKILLVEDNFDHADLFQYHVKSALDHGYELNHVTTLAQGVAGLATKPDIIFLDLKLPDSTQPKDTVDRFLKNNPNAPVIVLTSLNDEELGTWAIQSGAQDYLAKDSVTKSFLSKSIKFALERQHLTHNIRRANLELQESNQQLERFAYIASHDLQEPLRKINSFSQAIIEDCGDDISEMTRDYLNVISTAAKRMTSMIDDLLDLSRVGRRKLDLVVTPLSAILEEVLDNLDLSIRDNQARIVYGGLPAVACDKTLFVHLFQNLIGNAMKFHKPNVTPEISITAQETADLVEISVQDNGIGIPRDGADKIFEIFQRLHTYTQYPGTGIGLAVCRKIVERHEGKIVVESVEGEGSTFKVSIPKQRAGDITRET